jgi:glutathione synthase
VNQRSLAVIMDPIEAIKPWKDSSLAMLVEAQRGGWELNYAQVHDLWLEDGVAYGCMRELQVSQDESNWFQLAEPRSKPLGEFDLILMRKDPPFDLEYIMASYVLERAQDAGALVVNSPQGLRDANEKVALAWFSELAPPTLITRSIAAMREFIDAQQVVVVKPLDLMGGRSVFVTSATDGNHNVILETVSQYGKRTIMLQKYLPEISQSGDRRILLIDGQPLPWALARIPTGDDHRGNMDAGARTEVLPLTPREQFICERIGPWLQQKGLLFVGIDIIGGHLTEINVTSPTGIREIEQVAGPVVTSRLFAAIQARIESNPRK